MQGCGNDYIYFDCFEQTIKEPEALAVKLSDRHFGIGGDGAGQQARQRGQGHQRL